MLFRRWIWVKGRSRRALLRTGLGPTPIGGAAREAQTWAGNISPAWFPQTWLGKEQKFEGENYSNNIWIFKKLPHSILCWGLTKDSNYFPARTCCTPAQTLAIFGEPHTPPLTPTRRFAKAALGGFARTSGTYDFITIIFFLPKAVRAPCWLIFPLPQIARSLGSIPGVPGHVSFCSAEYNAWCSDPSGSTIALLPIRKIHRCVMTAIHSLSSRSKIISPASPPLSSHGWIWELRDSKHLIRW